VILAQEQGAFLLGQVPENDLRVIRISAWTDSDGHATKVTPRLGTLAASLGCYVSLLGMIMVVTLTMGLSAVSVRRRVAVGLGTVARSLVMNGRERHLVTFAVLPAPGRDPAVRGLGCLRWDCRRRQ